ncbi:MAG TPA: DNA topoisomerase IB [Aromatoleum sp.]|uniref:DNA topoisomerase IB n=1 Tax=Aromatoleum sp. TaxID=2307007 RepID=UPI002B485047|nr:DNA topoisomerase IB [Aromatoleum sp.]HJV24649.1 DNA topoisomerase IB [Aromatoleum sp.]
MGTVRTAELQNVYLRREPLPDGGFRYLHPDGRVYRNRADLARIASLAVPPAYTDVYVSPDPEATLQAFGRDAAGRLQYRYHPDFVRERAMGKWRRLARFAGALPQLRRRVTADLRRSGLPREKVLALLVRLLDRVHLRVGYAAYARRYRSYGLTTLRKRHVQIEGIRVTFRYRGKHGVEQEQTVRDRSVATTILRLSELSGNVLFQYLDGEGGRHVVRAEELNAYIRESIGRFTGKDFRSWGGTLKAAEFLAAAGPPESERSAGRILAACVRHVATELGNTAAVTRASYICPIIFDLYLAGTVVDDFGSARDAESGLSRSEAALRRMLARGLYQKRRSSAQAPRSALPRPAAGRPPPERGNSQEVQHDCR